MIGKKLGVDRWVPTQIVVFSILAAAQFFMQGRASFLALRFMIAFFQGGFIPDLYVLQLFSSRWDWPAAHPLLLWNRILYLSYFYTSTELPVYVSTQRLFPLTAIWLTDSLYFDSVLSFFWCISKSSALSFLIDAHRADPNASRLPRGHGDRFPSSRFAQNARCFRTCRMEVSRKLLTCYLYSNWSDVRKRWMFLIEGLATVSFFACLSSNSLLILKFSSRQLLIGVASFFLLPPGPSQTKSKLFPKGYFSDRETKIIVNRVVRDGALVTPLLVRCVDRTLTSHIRLWSTDPGKATMHNRQALTPKLLWKSMKDFDLYPMYLIGLTFGIPAYPIQNYFQLSMRSLGFSTLMANLLSIPHTVISMILLVAVTVLSELVESRTWLAILENVWFLPFFIALRTLPVLSGWQYFALATLLLAFPYVHALQVSWCSRNSGSVRWAFLSSIHSPTNLELTLCTRKQNSNGICLVSSRPSFTSRSIADKRLLQALQHVRSNFRHHRFEPVPKEWCTSILHRELCHHRYHSFQPSHSLVSRSSPRFTKNSERDWRKLRNSPGTWFYYRARNAWKEKRWSTLSTEQRAECKFCSILDVWSRSSNWLDCRSHVPRIADLETTKDEGCRRLDFRFVY